MSITILIGLQWGDEGKGKMVDILSQDHAHIVRSHGGANAGHTLVIKGQEFKFHLVPSGILHNDAKCYLAGGVVVDPEILTEEIQRLKDASVNYDKRLFISQRAHVLLPYHKFLDKALEELRGKGNIGTTGKGIGPCYTDKVGRYGITVEDFLDHDKCQICLENRYMLLPESVKQSYPLKQCLHDVKKWQDALRPFVCDVEHLLSQALKRKEKILMEGAHGSMLDVSYGTYPFVTSSGCIAASVLAGAGLGPTYVKRVCGVVKTYTTRVGSGPLPTALSDDEQKLFMDHHKAREIGTTTGRLRRMGWLDLPLLRRSIELSGVTDLVMTKLDILDDLDQIKICTHYQIDGKDVEIFPTNTSALDHAAPVYTTLKGWKTSTSAIKAYDKLPEEAKAYLQAIETMLGVKVSHVFVGPDREQTIVCP